MILSTFFCWKNDDKSELYGNSDTCCPVDPTMAVTMIDFVSEVFWKRQERKGVGGSRMARTRGRGWWWPQDALSHTSTVLSPPPETPPEVGVPREPRPVTHCQWLSFLGRAHTRAVLCNTSNWVYFTLTHFPHPASRVRASCIHTHYCSWVAFFHHRVSPGAVILAWGVWFCFLQWSFTAPGWLLWVERWRGRDSRVKASLSVVGGGLEPG